MLDRQFYGGSTTTNHLENDVDRFSGLWALNEEVFAEHAEALKNIVRITGE